MKPPQSRTHSRLPALFFSMIAISVSIGAAMWIHRSIPEGTLDPQPLFDWVGRRTGWERIALVVAITALCAFTLDFLGRMLAKTIAMFRRSRDVPPATFALIRLFCLLAVGLTCLVLGAVGLAPPPAWPLAVIFAPPMGIAACQWRRAGHSASPQLEQKGAQR